MTDFWTGCAAGAATLAAAGVVAWILFGRRNQVPAPSAPVEAEGGNANVWKEPLRLDKVLDALEEAVFVVDQGQTIRLANEPCRHFFPGAATLTGRTLAEITGEPALVDLVAQCFAGGLPGPVELKRGPEGDPLVWRADAAVVEGQGAAEFVRLILRDETERHRTEQIRREFVANASHELRTPLTIVRGYLENLLDGSVEDPDLAHRFLKTARKHTNRLSRLVEEMLTISKLESGDSALLREKPFSLRKCLARVVEHVHTLVEQRQAEVTVDFDPAVGRILGDRFYWEQVFFNLVENSLKNNTQPGLRVRILAQPTPEGGVEFRVEDNGVGIPRAALPFVFKRFYRVQQDGSNEMPGTGLGLSIVKRAVEAHGGTVEVESEPGVLTAFIIRLPKERVVRE